MKHIVMNFGMYMKLKKFEYKYNFERPHQALNYLTPMEFYNNMIKKSA